MPCGDTALNAAAGGISGLGSGALTAGGGSGALTAGDGSGALAAGGANATGVAAGSNADWRAVGGSAQDCAATGGGATGGGSPAANAGGPSTCGGRATFAAKPGWPTAVTRGSATRVKDAGGAAATGADSGSATRVNEAGGAAIGADGGSMTFANGADGAGGGSALAGFAALANCTEAGSAVAPVLDDSERPVTSPGSKSGGSRANPVAGGRPAVANEGSSNEGRGATAGLATNPGTTCAPADPGAARGAAAKGAAARGAAAKGAAGAAPGEMGGGSGGDAAVMPDAPSPAGTRARAPA